MMTALVLLVASAFLYGTSRFLAPKVLVRSKVRLPRSRITRPEGR